MKYPIPPIKPLTVLLVLLILFERVFPTTLAASGRLPLPSSPVPVPSPVPLPPPGLMLALLEYLADKGPPAPPAPSSLAWIVGAVVVIVLSERLPISETTSEPIPEFAELYVPPPAFRLPPDLLPQPGEE